DALDGREIQMVARELDFERDFIVAPDVLPRRPEAKPTAGAPDDEPAIPLDVGEADLGRVFPRDGAMRNQRRLVRAGPLGELIGLSHGARSNRAEEPRRGDRPQSPPPWRPMRRARAGSSTPTSLSTASPRTAAAAATWGITRC